MTFAKTREEYEAAIVGSADRWMARSFLGRFKWEEREFTEEDVARRFVREQPAVDRWMLYAGGYVNGNKAFERTWVCLPQPVRRYRLKT